MSRPRRPLVSAWLRFVLLGLVAGLGLGCDVRFARGAGPVTVGVVLPFGSEVQGHGAAKIREAFQRVLGDGDREVRLVYRDDGGLPARTAEIVRDLVVHEDVVAIVGTMTSPCALAAAERAEALAVPFVTPMATHVDVTRGREWVFRMCFTDPQQGAHMARFARGDLKLQRVAILRDVTNDYSIGLADAFAETFLSLGGVVVAERSYRRGFDQTSDLVAWLDQNPCDALYLPLYRADVVDVISKSAGRFGAHDLVFLGGDGWHSRELRAFLRQAPAVPRRIFITAHFAWDRPDEAVAELIRQHQDDGAGEPPTSSDALGHDTALLLRRVLFGEARTRPAVRDALLRELNQFHGATGTCSLDPKTGEMEKEVHVLTWTGDQWRRWEPR